ncbi:MAG TPA: sigma-70 family RNA polymerase sigma factor, partial [bacterium]|nr:sigma-70 family RNA polymerase sigma factor [bacterium]
IPVNLGAAVTKLMRASRTLTQKLGREPTQRELARATGLSVARVRQILEIPQQPASLEAPIGEDEDTSLGSLVADQEALGPEQALALSMLKEQVQGLLATLTPRERIIVRLRFGLGGKRPETLEEIGQRLKLTRERVRQIERRALQKLLQPAQAGQLGNFVA